jgi:hypothetical protein
MLSRALPSVTATRQRSVGYSPQCHSSKYLCIVWEAGLVTCRICTRPGTRFGTANRAARAAGRSSNRWNTYTACDTEHRGLDETLASRDWVVTYLAWLRLSGMSPIKCELDRLHAKNRSQSRLHHDGYSSFDQHQEVHARFLKICQICHLSCCL